MCVDTYSFPFSFSYVFYLLSDGSFFFLGLSVNAGQRIDPIISLPENFLPSFLSVVKMSSWHRKKWKRWVREKEKEKVRNWSIDICPFLWFFCFLNESKVFTFIIHTLTMTSFLFFLVIFFFFFFLGLKKDIYWSYGDFFMENLGRHLSNKIQTNKQTNQHRDGLLIDRFCFVFL